jgi:hypothetical protein
MHKRNRVISGLNLFGEGSARQHKIVVIDQIVSAGTNYLMVLVPFILGDWKSLGQVVMFQSFYVLFIGVSRATFGTTQLVKSDHSQGNKLLGLGILLGLASGAITSPFGSSIGINSLTVTVIFLFPIVQDVLRFERISKKQPVKALGSDLIWLFFSVLLLLLLIDSSLNLTTCLIISWAAGAAPASLYLLYGRFSTNHLSFVRSSEKISTIYLLRVGATALISEVNTITVNWLILLMTSATLLGEFRFFQIGFLPVAFLINLNRIILTPYYRDGDRESISIWLKKQFKLRLSFYALGVFVIVLLRGADFHTLIISLLTLIAIELAFNRNLIFQRLIAIGNEVVVLRTLILYYISSIFIFCLFSSLDGVLYLTFALVLVELLAYMIALHGRLGKNV